MRLTDTKKDLTGGGAGSFFKPLEAKPSLIRFLYNSIDDMNADGLVAHVIPKAECGQQWDVPVLCGAKTDETAMQDCKWCATNHKQVGRYPLALFNVETNTIQYWLKSAQYVTGLMSTLSEVVPAGQPVSGQVFKMIRTGAGPNTQYNLIPQGPNDGKLPNQFGEIKAPEERNLLKPADYEFPVVANGGANFQANYNQGGYNQNAYGNNAYGNQGNMNYQGRGRATTDVF